MSIASSPLFGNIQETSISPPRSKGGNKLSQFRVKGKGSSFGTSVTAVNSGTTNVKTTQTNLPDKSTKMSCLLCEEGHKLELCPKMEKKLHREKIKFFKEKGACFGCLSVGHMSRDCHRRLSCTLWNMNYPTILHIHSKDKENKSKDTPRELSVNSGVVSPETCGHIGAGAQDCVLAIVPVQIKATKGSKIIKTYAFLDPGSTAAFCSERLMRELKLSGRHAKIMLRTMNQEKFVDSHIISGLEVAALNSDIYFELPDVYTQCKMPVTRNNIPKQEEISAWPHLNSVEIPVINADVELLIETNVLKVMEPWEVVNSEGEGPCAGRTLLGWVLSNRYVVEQRALCLKRKLKNNAAFKEEYVSFLSDVINKGYAERVPEKDLEGKEGKVWYIPHLGVRHPKKGTLRVVFDCGASFTGISLNSQLLQGPDLTNSLLGVLIRFRQEPTAVMADVRAMYQVKVNKEDVDFLRFLWWPNGDLTQPLTNECSSVWFHIISQLCQLCPKKSCRRQ